MLSLAISACGATARQVIPTARPTATQTLTPTASSTPGIGATPTVTPRSVASGPSPTPLFGPTSTAQAVQVTVIVIPVIGGIIVGFMARYGHKGIRGHGIPEAMEQVLLNQSRIPPRITFLKPLSAAIAIGTGGPFGAEGPIIATGGALGSLIGQIIRTT
ncbi:MAG: chloride channel protein, partial [Chloroflexota bacterium]